MPLKKFVSELHAIEFADETSHAAIKANRTKLCEVVAKQTAALFACIWISYHDDAETRLFCYYSNSSLIASLKPRQKMVALPSRETDDTVVAHLLAAQLNSALKHGEATTVKSYPAKDIFFQTGRAASRNLGWISFGIPTALSESPVVDVVGTTAAIVLSHQIDRGRISRIRSSHNELRGLLRNTGNIPDALAKACDFLSTFASFNTALTLDGKGKLVSVSGKVRENGFDDFVAEFLKNESLSVGDDVVRPFQYRAAKEAPKFDSVEPTNSISIQICVPGYEFTNQRFQAAWNFESGVVPQRARQSTLLLLDRHDETHFGDVSPTELELCRFAAHELETFINDHHFEAVVSMIQDSLSKADPVNPLDDDTIRQMADLISPNIVGMFTARYFFSQGELIEDTDQADRVQGRRLPKTYFTRLARTAAKYVDDNKKRFPDEARIGFAIDGNRTFLEFHLSNAYEPVRYYIFEFNSKAITRDELRVFRYLVAEISIRWRNFDSAEERKTLFAQIRHAIIDPVAAASNALIFVQREAKYAARKGPISWAELSKNDIFFDCIEKSVYLVNQAKMLAETGRYLFSNLRFSDLKTDHYDILKITRRVLGIFSHYMRTKKMIAKLTVKGTQPRIVTGDSLLIWVALANLIDNGIKYAKSTSTLTVSLEFRQSTYVFKVSNDGQYLPPEIKEKLFAPYFRGPQPDALNKKHGTGIGLPVTSMILEAHSPIAALKYVSEKREGNVAQNTFFFEMPYLVGKSAGRVIDGARV